MADHLVIYGIPAVTSYDYVTIIVISEPTTQDQQALAAKFATRPWGVPSTN